MVYVNGTDSTVLDLSEMGMRIPCTGSFGESLKHGGDARLVFPDGLSVETTTHWIREGSDYVVLGLSPAIPLTIIAREQQRLLSLYATCGAWHDPSTVEAHASVECAGAALGLNTLQLIQIVKQLPLPALIVHGNDEILYTNRQLINEFGHVGGYKCYEYLWQRTAPCAGCIKRHELKVARKRGTYYEYFRGVPVKVDYAKIEENDRAPVFMKLIQNTALIAKAIRTMCNRPPNSGPA